MKIRDDTCQINDDLFVYIRVADNANLSSVYKFARLNLTYHKFMSIRDQTTPSKSSPLANIKLPKYFLPYIYSVVVALQIDKTRKSGKARRETCFFS